MYLNIPATSEPGRCAVVPPGNVVEAVPGRTGFVARLTVAALPLVFTVI